MKRSRMTLLAFLSTLLLLGTLRAHAQENPNVDDLAAKAYLALLAGDNARNNQNWVASLKSYEDALAVYQQIRDTDPDYKGEIMEYRLQYCREMIEEVSGKAATQPVSPPVAAEGDGYKARYEDLLDKSRRLASMVKGLQDEAARAQELESENNKLTATLARLSAGDADTARLGQRVRELQEELAGAKAELASLRSRPAPEGASRQELDAMRRDLNDANKALLDSQQALRFADATVQQLQQQIRQSEGSGTAGQAHAAALDAELNKVRQEKAATEAALAQLRAETEPILNALTLEQQSLNQNLAEARKRILQLEAELGNAGKVGASQLAEAREALRRTEGETEQLKQRVVSVENQLREAAESHARELESLKASASASQGQIVQGLENENRQALAQVRELEKRLRTLSDVEAELAGARAAASAAQAQLEGFREATNTQLAESRRQAALAQAQQDAMGTRMRDLEAQLSTLSASQSGLSNERDQLLARVQNLTRDLAAAQAAGDKSAEIESLNLSLSQSIVEQTRLERALADLRREKETQGGNASARIATLESELTVARAAADKSEDIERLTLSLRNSARQAEELRGQLAEMQAVGRAADARAAALEAELQKARALGEKASEVEGLATALREAQTERQALADKFADLEARSGTWQTQLQTALREVAKEAGLREELEKRNRQASLALEQLKAEQVAERDRAAKGLAEALAENRARQEALSREQGRVRALEAELDAEKSSLAAAVRELQGKTGAQREEWALQVENLERAKKNVGLELAASQDKVAEMQAVLERERQSMAGKIAEIEAQAGTDREEIAASLLATQKALDSAKTDHAAALAKARETDLKFAGEMAALRKELDATATQRKELAENVLHAQRAKEAAEEQGAKATARIQALEAELAAARRAQAEQEATGEVVARLQAELKVLHEEKQVLEIQQRSTLGQFEQLNQNHGALQRQHQAALEKIAEAERAAVQWAESEKVLAEYRSQEPLLRARLSDLQAQLQDIEARNRTELDRKDEGYRNLSELLAVQSADHGKLTDELKKSQAELLQARQQINSLNLLVTEKGGSVEDLRKELDSLHASLREMSGKTDAVEGESLSLQALLQESIAAKEEARAELLRAQGQATEYAAELEVLRAGLEESQATIEEQGRVMAGLQAQAERVNEFQGKLVDETEARKLAEQNLRKLADHIAEMRKEIAADKRKQEELQAEVAKLVEANIQLGRFKSEAEAAAFSLRESRETENQARADLAKLKVFVKQVAEENTERQKTFVVMQAELALLQAQVPEQRKKIEDLSAELDTTQGDAVNLATRLEESTRRIAQLEKVEVAFTENLGQFKTLSGQYQDLAEAYQALQVAYGAATNEWASLRKEVGILEQALGTTGEQTMDLNSRLQQGTATIALLQSQLHAAERSLLEADQLRDRAVALERTAESLHGQNKEYEQLALSLQQELQAAIQHVENTKREKDRLEAQVASQTKERELLAAKLAASEQALANASATAAQARELESALGSVRKDLQAAQTAHAEAEAGMKALASQVSSLEEAKAGLQNQFSETSRKLRQAESRIQEEAASHTRETELLAAKLSAREQALENASATVAQAEKLEAEIGRLRMDVLAAKTAEEERAADLETAKRERASLDAANAELQAKLSDTTRQLLEAEFRIKELSEQQQEILGRLRRVLGQAN